MKKHKFAYSQPLDFTALAVVSPEKDYKLCHLINKALHIDLDKSGVIYAGTNTKDNTKTTFPAFVYTDPENDKIFYIVKNKNEGNFLMPQMKQVDYLFIMKGREVEKYIENLKAALTQIPYIHSTFAITNNQLTHLNFE